MTTEEQAKKYGVPMPEMCKLLEPYLNATTLMWCEIGGNGYRRELDFNLNKGDHILCLSSPLQYGNVDYFTPELVPAFEMSDTEEDIPAPQIHELLELIQKDCTTNKYFLELKMANKDSFSGSYKEWNDQKTEIYLAKYSSENNLADFLADFYLKIKQEGKCPAPTITHPK